MITKKIYIVGIVQGVGFRPFVKKTAKKFDIKGYVKNINSNALIIIQQKDSAKIADFIHYLTHNKPQNAIISSIKISEIKSSVAYQTFSIKQSVKSKDSTRHSAIPLDVALCKKCEKELISPKNRRFNYAFINCINCGPRYTIIKSLPYDRERTAMSEFEMCENCKSEYKNISNRRFHAQPNSCPKCGIKLKLYDNQNREVKIADSAGIFAFLQSEIESGKILCMKGIGGFNLICKVEANAIASLRKKKSRPRKPFAIMFSDLKSVKAYFNLTKIEENALLSPSAPIVLLKNPKVKLPQNLAFHLDTVGVIIAYSALHKLLFANYTKPLIFTSANLSQEPIIATKCVAQVKLSHIFDYLLDYNRDICNPIDDSLKFILHDKIATLRAGRGDYPLLLRSNLKSKETILALGANQKSQIAIFFRGYVLLSRYIGDLSNIDTINALHKEIAFLLKLYNLTPSVILCDCHKGYESHKIAQELARNYNARFCEIFHHRAHFYSNILDNDIKDRAILGVVFDGTGFGEDGTIWGGEFFMCDKRANDSTLNRIAHFETFPLLGGESAIKDISKIALALLFKVYGEAIPLEIKNKDLLYQVYKKGINSPQTSSVGRIFDFVAFMCGLESQSFEGESGGFVESLFNPQITESYGVTIKNGKISLDGIIRGIVADIKNGGCDENRRCFRGDSNNCGDSGVFARERGDFTADSSVASLIASKFINTLANIILEITLQKRAEIPQLAVLFSGGVFANKALCDRIAGHFQTQNIKHYFHSKIPANDGGIASGQILAFLSGDYKIEG